MATDPIRWKSVHTTFHPTPNEQTGQLCYEKPDDMKKVVDGRWEETRPFPPPHTDEAPPDFVCHMGSKTPLIDWSEWQTSPRVVFSGNALAREKFGQDSPSLLSLDQLIPSFEPLYSAFVTTFMPWDKSFLIDHFPRDTELTIVVSPKPVCELEPGGQWICHHSLHGEIECDLCGEVVDYGTEFVHCHDCGIDFCPSCNAKERREITKILGQKFKGKEFSASHCMSVDKHQRHNDHTETFVAVTSEDCSCTRKRFVRVVHAPLVEGEYSIMHIKLMLLLYRTHLRIVISSFNLDEDMQWETFTDSFWIQDFPLANKSATNSLFIDKLVQLISALGCDEWARKLNELDLDLSCLDPNTRLIVTVPNPFRPKNNQRWDWCGLTNITGALKHWESARYELSPVFVTAFSVGGAGFYWLGEISRALETDLSESLRVVFHDCVTIYDSEMKLRKCGSMWHVADDQDGLKWHSKMIFRLASGCKCDTLHGWVYIGSHNWSKASWGTTSCVANLWELGVLSMSHCGGQLDMRCIPQPFAPDRVHPFNHSDKWIVRKFGEMVPVSCSRLCIVHSIQRNEAWLLAQDDDDEPSWSHKVVLPRRVWEYTGSPQPPDIGALLEVRVVVSEKEKKATVVWVERIFVCDQPSST